MLTLDQQHAAYEKATRDGEHGLRIPTYIMYVLIMIYSINDVHTRDERTNKVIIHKLFRSITSFYKVYVKPTARNVALCNTSSKAYAEFKKHTDLICDFQAWLTEYQSTQR